MTTQHEAASLTDDYIAQAERDARRFQGAWTGTSGTLAAHVIRLLTERKALMESIDSIPSEYRDTIKGYTLTPAEPSPQDPVEPHCVKKSMPKEALAAAWEACRARASAVRESVESGAASVLEQEVHEAEPRMTGDGVMHADPYSEWLPGFQDQHTTPAEKLLLDALAVIRDRRPKYGGPKKHFARTVGMINAAFSEVLKRPLTPADWAIFMTLDKVARYCGPNKTADGPIDLAGYAACLAEAETDEE